jgi:hypothetical protein
MPDPDPNMPQETFLVAPNAGKGKKKAKPAKKIAKKPIKKTAKKSVKKVVKKSKKK